MLYRFGNWVEGKRAQEYVARYHPKVIGVVGTSQAALTVRAISLVLQDEYTVRASDLHVQTPPDSISAIIGVAPTAAERSWWRTLIGSRARELAEKEPEVIVVEIPSSHPGYVSGVANQIPFNMGVAIDIGSMNLDLFGSKEMAAHEQLALLASLPSSAAAVINHDEPLLAAMAKHTKAHIHSFGSASQANIQVRRVHHIGAKGLAAEIGIKGSWHEVALPHLVGRHQLPAVAAALAVAQVLQVPIASALHDIKALRPIEHHLSVKEGINGILVLDDSAGATAEDTLQALDTLAQLPARRRIAILGDISDAGSMSVAAYQAIGSKVVQAADMFIAVGEGMRQAQTAVLKQGGVDTHHFSDSRDVGKWLAEYIRPGDVILVKGSQAMNMKAIVERLQN